MSDTEPTAITQSLRRQLVTAIADYPVACWTPGNLADRMLAVRDRDMRVLGDEVTRLSAVTGQLRALATRWQATVRPGEQHPAAAAILNIIEGNGPSVREAAANDRRWFDCEKEGQ